MWLVLTVICAVATYLAVLYLDSLVPAFIFLALAIIFLTATWRTRKGRR